MTVHLQLFLIAVAGRLNRHQQVVIEYLQEENRVLLEQLGGKSKRLTNAQRIRLARKANLVGRRRLGQVSTIVTPDTLLRWFRVLVAKKWTSAKTNPVGRPPLDPELEKLVIKLIPENPTWGSNRIVGALDNLGCKVSDSTVDNIRQRNGLDPAPVRSKRTTWRQFLRAHWESLVAADFFTTEVLSWNGLARLLVDRGEDLALAPMPQPFWKLHGSLAFSFQSARNVCEMFCGIASALRLRTGGNLAFRNVFRMI